MAYEALPDLCIRKYFTPAIAALQRRFHLLVPELDFFQTKRSQPFLDFWSLLSIKPF
ncbi:MAG: hypothetical protein Ct9H300mP28_29850 [Pseudomonadota bacterium]|nr:MAG: hypothetical protein Ct9H300mP28_29850 [Pseudomonadota bacterium]